MSRHLAVLTPCLGAPSETFIRRHVNDLAERVTVVHTYEHEGEPHWTTDHPTVNPTDHLGLAAKVAAKLQGQHEAFQRPTVRRRLVRELVDREVEVVLAEYLDYWLDVLEDLYAAGIEVWGHAHGYDISETLRDPEARAAYRTWAQADGVISMAKHAVPRLVDCGIDAERIHVVHSGVDAPPEFQRRADRPPTFVAVGRLVAKKDPVSLIRAFGQVAERDRAVRLVMIGAGPLERAAAAEVKRLGLDPQVSLTGARSNTEVKTAMDDADVFVQHSRVDPQTGDEEGLPVSVLEAMASGLPVVTTRHAGIPDAVLHGETGFLVDEGDVDGMAQHMALLAGDADRREAMGRAGHQRILHHFTWERERSALRALLRLDP